MTNRICSQRMNSTKSGTIDLVSAVVREYSYFSGYYEMDDEVDDVATLRHPINAQKENSEIEEFKNEPYFSVFRLQYR